LIPDFFLGLAFGFTEWILSFFPQMTEAEGMIVTASNGLTSIILGASSLGIWVPWGTIAACLGITTGAYIAMFILKIIRVLAAHIPLIGGKG
jgi:hypothetical protein